MHVAVIMDGNGRWAGLRGLPRTLGHHAGTRAVKRIVEAAGKLPIDMLTLYAFSADNWARPAPEVEGIFGLMQRYLQNESARCAENGIEVRFIGRRDRFSTQLRELITQVEALTRGGQALRLRIAADYSARSRILAAARRVRDCDIDPDTFGTLVADDSGSDSSARNVDLLIRTGGERRLSDFLLWECAYAEFVFSDTYWPDFDEHALHTALEEFRNRDRRFGSVFDKPKQRLAGELT
jgi:undecaprenyl diphosphate synthase